MFRLADILNFSNSFYVIDAEVVDGNSHNYSLTSMTRKNEDVDFSFLVLNTHDIEEIQKNIPDEANVGIVINGKGTLYRTIKDCAEEDNSATLLNRILPDANVDDYYLQAGAITLPGTGKDSSHQRHRGRRGMRYYPS